MRLLFKILVTKLELYFIDKELSKDIPEYRREQLVDNKIDMLENYSFLAQERCEFWRNMK